MQETEDKEEVLETIRGNRNFSSDQSYFSNSTSGHQ